MDSERGENDLTNFFAEFKCVGEGRREDDLRARRDDGAAFYPRLTNRWRREKEGAAAFLVKARSQRLRFFIVSFPATSDCLGSDYSFRAQSEQGEGQLDWTRQLGRTQHPLPTAKAK